MSFSEQISVKEQRKCPLEVDEESGRNGNYWINSNKIGAFPKYINLNSN